MLDSREHHSHGAALEVDSAKRRALAAAGWIVVAVTWRQLTAPAERHMLLADLVRILGRAEARSGPGR